MAGVQGGLSDIEREKRSPLALVERPLEDEVILSLRFGHFILNQGMLAYLHRGGVLLPLSVVTDSLDFLVEVDLGAGQAEGFFITEDRRFSLDLVQGYAVVRGKTIPFNPKLIELHEDDIYVDSTLFGQWFPVDLKVDLSRLELSVKASEFLPLEKRLEREKRQTKLRPDREKKVYPRVTAPYQFLDWPFIDNIVSTRYDNQSDEVLTSYSTVVSGDLLWMNSMLRLAGSSEDELSDVRLTFGRRDPGGNLLGFMHATGYFLGDVFNTQTPLVTSNREGVGFTVSSFSIAQQTEFDRINLRGELPPGWQAELYRNQTLLSSQFSNADGRYEFLDVPLLYGNNIIRLAFYGPQGQFKEKIQVFNIGQNQVRPDQQFFRVSVNYSGRDLIPVAEKTGGLEVQNEPRAVFEFEKGLNRFFRCTLAEPAFLTIPLEEEEAMERSVFVPACSARCPN